MEPLTINIQTLIKDDLAKLRKHLVTGNSPLQDKIPPEPRRSGDPDSVGPGQGPWRKAGKRVRIQFRFQLDAVLFDLFETELKALGITGGQLITQILYNRYGCPPLSFQAKSRARRGSEQETPM